MPLLFLLSGIGRTYHPVEMLDGSRMNEYGVCQGKPPSVFHRQGQRKRQNVEGYRFQRYFSTEA